ncbi:MAG: hypothetical protein AAFV29_17325, partial [Myxococcota bacterium]
MTKSRLSEEIDPKTFFMMLNTNYAVLYRDEVFDLSAVWEALSGQHSAEVLYGLFLRFSDTLEQAGIQSRLPSEVDALTAEERQHHQLLFNGVSAPEQEAEIVEMTDSIEGPDGTGKPAPLLELRTADIRPFISTEMRRDVVQAVLTAIKASPAGDRVESAQLAYLINDNFDSLCDGATFNLDPVLQGLKELGNITDADLYLASALLKESLPAHNLALTHQLLDVSEAEGQQIIAAYEEEQKRLKRDSFRSVKHALDAPEQPPARQPTSNRETSQENRVETRESRLRQLGLGQGDAKARRRLRFGLVAVIVLAIGIPAYLFRPDRPLAIGMYGKSVPLLSAKLYKG